MKTVFIDTNIVLDVLTQRQPYLNDSAEIWTLCETGKLRGFISAITFNNIFYVARKVQGKDAAYQMLDLLRSVFSTVPLDEQAIQQSLAARLPDFEDAIQFHAAVRCAAQAIITRNASDFPNTGPPILSPKEFLASQTAT